MRRANLLALGAALLIGSSVTAALGAPADNIVFFLGDGMGPATVTAARIYRYGEAGRLKMESLPRTARVRTHSLDAQTTDSAPSMSAYMTGVKMNNEVLSMSPDTVADLYGCTAQNGKPVAILKNSQLVGYLVPAEAAQGLEGHRYATREEVMASLERTRERAQPVLDYLRDK